MKGVRGKGILRWPYRVRAKTYVEGDKVPIALLSTADPTRGHGTFKVPLPKGFGREDNVPYRAVFDVGNWPTRVWDEQRTLALQEVVMSLTNETRKPEPVVLFVSCCHAAARGARAGSCVGTCSLRGRRPDSYNGNIWTLRNERDNQLPSEELRPEPRRLEPLQRAIETNDMYHLNMHGATLDTKFIVPSDIAIVFFGHPGRAFYGPAAEKLLEQNAQVREYTTRLIMQSMDLKYVTPNYGRIRPGSFRVYSRTYLPGEVLQDIAMVDDPVRSMGVFKVPTPKYLTYYDNKTKTAHLDLRSSLGLGSKFTLSSAVEAIRKLPMPPTPASPIRVLFVTCCRSACNDSICALSTAQNMRELKGMRHVGNGHWSSNENDKLKTTKPYGDFIQRQLWLMKDARTGKQRTPIQVDIELAVTRVKRLVRQQLRKSQHVPAHVKGELTNMLQAIRQRVGKRGGPVLTRELTESLQELQELSQ